MMQVNVVIARSRLDPDDCYLGRIGYEFYSAGSPVFWYLFLCGCQHAESRAEYLGTILSDKPAAELRLLEGPRYQPQM